MRIWVDLANSPHPLLFAPVVRELEGRGHEVMLTARDHGQTADLATRQWPEVDLIGGESPATTLRKAGSAGGRVRALRQWAKQRRPDLALSHNSYAQIVAARSIGITVVTAMDFEHQPANHLAFRLASRVILPEAFPLEQARRQGAKAASIHRYKGYKEEIYLGEFDPSPDVLGQLGIERGNEVPLVVARTPPSGALYHRFENPLFAAALQTLDRGGARSVALARHPEQRRALEALGLRLCTIPATAIDAPALMYQADLFLGAGGTMTREAALMGVPTVSAFAGEAPAVDRALIEAGRLTRLEGADALEGLGRRKHSPMPVEVLRERGRIVNRDFVDAVLGAG